jgi:multiple sugar transport system permease protein
MISYKLRRVLRNTILAVAIVFITAQALVPIYWMVSTSITSDAALYSGSLVPLNATLDNYIRLVTCTPNHCRHGDPQGRNILLYMGNSTMIAVSVMVISLLASMLAGYSLSRLSFKGKNIFSVSILFTYVFPSIVLLPALYMLLVQLNLVNTLLGVVILDLTFALPFSVWVISGYFQTIPVEIEESALVDGCTRLGVLFRIVLPLAAPGLATVAVYSFIQSWDDLVFAMITLSTESLQTLPLASLYMIVGSESVFWGQLMALAVMGSVVPAVLFVILQKNIAQGLTAGAVKA